MTNVWLMRMMRKPRTRINIGGTLGVLLRHIRVTEKSSSVALETVS